MTLEQKNALREKVYWFCLALWLIASACSAPPFVPPDTSGVPPDLGAEREVECSEYQADFSDYIIGVPGVVRIRHRWNYNWCVVLYRDFIDFEGSWYFQGWETSFPNWEQLNSVILLVNDRPLAWYVDGVVGFDAGYDVAPYMSFTANTQKTREEGYVTRVCVPVTVDLDAWTSRERVDFSYSVTTKVCPDPEWLAAQ